MKCKKCKSDDVLITFNAQVYLTDDGKFDCLAEDTPIELTCICNDCFECWILNIQPDGRYKEDTPNGQN